MSVLRLDKLLANMGYGTRTEVKTIIRKGRIAVNQEICRNADRKIDTQKDQVTLDDVLVTHEDFEYHMLNKPAGCVSAVTDRNYPTVLDYVSSARKKDLFPVGRLDLDTEGLLLITNDGELAHGLLAPGKHVDKTYYAHIRGRVTEEDVLCFQRGLDIGEKKATMPAQLKIIVSAEISQVEITIQEGKFHQIKRMFQALDKEVVYLKRISMACLKLDEKLLPGESRLLTQEEIRGLRK